MFDPSSRHVGYVTAKVALGWILSEYFGFPCQSSYHRILHSRLLSGAGTIDQLLADVASGVSFIHHHEKRGKITDRVTA
jgi:hypothetical protein